MLRRMLSTFRLRRGPALQGSVQYSVAREPDGSLTVETYAGGWVPVDSAGRAFVGALRAAGLTDEAIRAELLRGLKTLEER